MSKPTTLNAKYLLITLLKIILMGVILYFLYRQIDSHWAQIRDHNWQFDYRYLTAAIIGGLLALLVIASNWKGLIAGFGYDIPLRRVFRVFYLADLGRYIPGKIWAMIGFVYLGKKEGLPPEQAAASFVLAQLFLIPASFLIFALAVQYDSRILVDQVALLGEYSAYTLTAVMTLVAAIIVLWPGRVLALANALLRRIGRPEVGFALDKKVALTLFLRYLLGWFFYGAAFWLFVRAVFPDSGLSLIAAAGIYAAAYQIGYLSLFAPGGLGPRELVMGFMLAPFLGPLAPAVAILARLWVIVVEVLAALIALAIRK